MSIDEAQYSINKARYLITLSDSTGQTRASHHGQYQRVIYIHRLASCKGALNPTVVYSTDRSKAVVPVLVLLFVALWFILRGYLLNVSPCVILFLCFSVLLVLRLPRLGKRELILVLFVRLFDFCLFDFVCFLFLFVSGKGCGL